MALSVPPLHHQIVNSPFLMAYISFNNSSKNLVTHQDIIFHSLTIFLFLSTCRLDNASILQGELIFPTPNRTLIDEETL